MSTAGSNVPSAILSRYQEEFLTILSKALTGTPVDANLISQNRAGCLGLILFPYKVQRLHILSNLFLSVVICDKSVATNTTPKSFASHIW